MEVEEGALTAILVQDEQGQWRLLFVVLTDCSTGEFKDSCMELYLYLETDARLTETALTPSRIGRIVDL